jgi:hypothetical protein
MLKKQGYPEISGCKSKGAWPSNQKDFSIGRPKPFFIKFRVSGME